MNKLIRQLNHEIIESLSARRPEGLPGRRTLQDLLRSPAWEAGLEALFPIKERLSCAHVLELCAPILDQLCPRPPEKGWGPFCYQFICLFMFPE